MTMKTASPFMTPCEALRQINDLCQEDTDKDKRIRKLLLEFEILSKKLVKEVNKRNGAKVNNKWWEENKLDWRDLSKTRMSDIYKT